MAEAFPSLFEKARLGDLSAREVLYKSAFFRLKGIASALLRHERAGHTLQPTALVSELFLKLQRFESAVVSEDHFFRISARAMRQVLIDHARVRKPVHRMPPELVARLLAPAHASPPGPESLLAVKQTFEKLRKMDPQVAETVWLRSVEGATVGELGHAQQREDWRVRADYEFGLRWMANRLNGQSIA